MAAHVDSDHLDGLFDELRRPSLHVDTCWLPCFPAFERHNWLFHPRIQRGLERGRELETLLVSKGTATLYPVEDHALASQDERFRLHVLSPPARVLEHLLLDADTLELFTRYPMPQGWLLLDPSPGPQDEPSALGGLRSRLETSTFLVPGEMPTLPPTTPGSIDLLGLKDEWGRTFNTEPEFFGNPVLNDTSLVILAEARLDRLHRRRVLLSGDLENWLYLTSAMAHS